MENQEILKSDESLGIIRDMIAQAKVNVAESRFYMLFWGWLVLIGSLGHFALDYFTNYPHPHIVWLITIPGIIITLIYGFKRNRKRRVKTYPIKIYANIWFSFLAIYVVLVLFIATYNYNIVPFILLFAGNATYLSGLVLRFKSYQLGGIWIFAMAIISFMVTTEIQLMLSASAILGYLIPAYTIKNKKDE